MGVCAVNHSWRWNGNK